MSLVGNEMATTFSLLPSCGERCNISGNSHQPGNIISQVCVMFVSKFQTHLETNVKARITIINMIYETFLSSVAVFPHYLHAT